MATIKPMRLIGLTGMAGVGKDTVREILETECRFTGLAFADPMRHMIRALFCENGISERWMDDRIYKELPITELAPLAPSYRHLMQTLGTEWGRHCVGPDFWVSITANYMKEQMRFGHNNFVISDVRFLNEAMWVHEMGGEIWRIKRGATPVIDHVSETEQAQIKVDKVINNFGTFEELWLAVKDALGQHEELDGEVEA